MSRCLSGCLRRPYPHPNPFPGGRGVQRSLRLQGDPHAHIYPRQLACLRDVQISPSSRARHCQRACS
ncbi:hypothetical protein XAP412_960087 [Xanthomonas phaseoli pv. phaseoli]|uniref:Uncharacterized protein n=1 Tax=Xanthomonas campestris pv. phaseoli TaxID=317013 RepID=A0AB38E965_XANCH|nr:hypothetical protein XAP6984_990090 [Xanthomonas phaseoli pv. phaseoli]SON91858.1 hypothetical protein XAP412_960087 [Xanthomonas phaseoli pv. phaseoli]SON93189.1 hypothetical protein XAP7430_980088 [Xanthomonas phaseoli pv. phaseoli]SOO30218.1 hypothetical protein XAP6164_4170018 [Xanthomonas phaseoli pv. phaseoli]